MESCPNCESTAIRKDGKIRGKQRYLCKRCDYRFTVQHTGKPINKKREALLMYLLGYDYRTIAGIIKVSHVTVFKWIKEFGPSISMIRMDKQKPVSFLDIEAYQKGRKDIKAILFIGFIDGATEIMLAK